MNTRFYFPADKRVETMWVSLTGVDEEVGGYTGKLLNTPNSKADVHAGSQVTVRVVPGSKEPLWVSGPMRENLKKWKSVCSACGFDMFLTSLDEQATAQFPTAPKNSEPIAFTTRCPICRKTMNVEALPAQTARPAAARVIRKPSAAAPPKPAKSAIETEDPYSP